MSLQITLVRTYKRMGGGPHAKAYNSEQLEVAIASIKDGESLQKVSAETGVPLVWKPMLGQRVLLL